MRLDRGRFDVGQPVQLGAKRLEVVIADEFQRILEPVDAEMKYVVVHLHRLLEPESDSTVPAA